MERYFLSFLFSLVDDLRPAPADVSVEAKPFDAGFKVSDHIAFRRDYQQILFDSSTKIFLFQAPILVRHMAIWPFVDHKRYM